ncbi:accessory Sec system glycosylation chaperone GtfB [Streptococcus pseudoporcinus]|uniref:UDP-N-acetylglucosamine--peptide N-acetylglucosaminyltransferase stabilizing protein GtfB n=1 Tax=Streptococcus pseudoporcinus LQ 940-04 TaxID=875093 RepID=G5K928_9STRE|nr:accessory Sec system glycosylation chaperone GtfB [Streptococcus pseudoporcinus]EFR44388.1 accessory Sec system glycosyltransferase GtfB [Streptococcus pseudoporcinus SPIN 20026]EHI64048.1 accessory Sec system glycosyltransferase GtfB [Streptococcus pseudoporcinus LQ 940-04]VEF93503.1 accessory Sec system glycosyltransferase GtfB [Streptococcus pseudoporcinus]
MLNIFENYDQAAQDLHYSLVMSGYKHSTVILNETGFLPTSVTTPYAFFMGEEQVVEGKARYFNQIKTPNFWEIQSNNNNGEILDHDIKKANIFYAEPTHKRLVRAVEWLDREGKVRLVEHYNKNGRLYAQSVYNKEQSEVLKTYYDQEGKEKIVENFVTNDLILNDRDKIKIFKSKLEFMIYYLQKASFDLDQIIYNSLALPFQISIHLPEPGHDILVWQEEFRGAIPGNMQAILNGTVARSCQVIIPDPLTYQTFVQLHQGENEKVNSLGYLYPLAQEKNWSANALIFTNSDQLEQIESLVTGLPDLQFHIGALTEMSPKLQALGQKDNVFLYPNLSPKTITALWTLCSVYLDINHGNEILNANRVAFEQRMPIYAFDNTQHTRHYILPKNTFRPNRVDDMIKAIALLAHPSRFKEVIEQQLVFANHTSQEAYREVLG